MPRKAKVIRCDELSRKKLEKIVNSPTQEQRMVQRAQLILACCKGSTLQKISEEYQVQAATVIKWRDRFEKNGLAGLQDRPRSGKPITYGKAFEEKVLRQLEQPPPHGLASWDGPSLAKTLNVSVHAIWRLLKKHGIGLARQRTWCISTDPHFAAKAADVVGLYVNPPERAVVIAVDEKPTIQALERRTGYVLTHNKKIVRGLQSTYKRHGTVNLFAALEVASGQIRANVTKEKKRADFLSFLEDLLTDYASDQELHIIMDNHSIHKKLDSWLEQHPNVHFHYTPTSASWLNMVEIWFGIFTRKVLKGASFSDTEDLTAKILQYLEAYKEEAHPFIWKKREVTGSQLKYNIRNLCN